jgi:RNA-directed DNA polymerase
MSAIWTLKRLARRFLVVPSLSKARVSDDLMRLSWMLDVSPAELLNFCSSRGRDARYHYRPLRRAKRDGGHRDIVAPSPDLKRLQRALLRHYLESLPVHAAAMGFRRGLSVADNARVHLGQAVVITADLEDFFGSTSAQRVRAYFQAQGWDALTTSALTGLCTFKGALPQGAPTSPSLSNLVNVPLDAALAALVNRSGGLYTRYGDDLTFSWPTQRVLSNFENRVLAVLLTYAYRLNATKGWHVYRTQRGDTPCVTGILLGRDGRLHPNDQIKRTVAHLRRQARRDPRDISVLAKLYGYQGFLHTLTSDES